MKGEKVNKSGCCAATFQELHINYATAFDNTAKVTFVGCAKSLLSLKNKSSRKIGLFKTVQITQSYFSHVLLMYSDNNS